MIKFTGTKSQIKISQNYTKISKWTKITMLKYIMEFFLCRYENIVPIVFKSGLPEPPIFEISFSGSSSRWAVSHGQSWS